MTQPSPGRPPGEAQSYLEWVRRLDSPERVKAPDYDQHNPWDVIWKAWSIQGWLDDRRDNGEVLFVEHRGHEFGQAFGLRHNGRLLSITEVVIIPDWPHLNLESNEAFRWHVWHTTGENERNATYHHLVVTDVDLSYWLAGKRTLGKFDPNTEQWYGLWPSPDWEVAWIDAWWPHQTLYRLLSERGV